MDLTLSQDRFVRGWGLPLERQSALLLRDDD